MNILITGSGGILGRNLLTKINSKKNKIYLITSRKNNLSNNQYKIINVNLSKKISNENLMKILSILPKRINKFYHCSSQVINSKSLDDHNLLENNLNITKNVLSISKIINIDTFINMSSISVYQLFNEKYKATNDFHYSFSKLFAELKFFKEIKSKNFINLRIGYILTKDPEGRGVLNSIYQDFNKFNIIKIYGNGKKDIEYIDINLLLKKILKYSDSKGFKTVKLVQNSISVIDYAKKIKKKHGNNKTIIKFL